MRNLRKLSRLELWGCSELEVNLANINLESIEVLDLSGCCSLLKSYPESSKEVDPWRGGISSLRRLVIRGMKKLVSLPQLPGSLLELDAQDCESLERLDCSFRNPDIRLNFANCFKLNQQAIDLIIQTPTNGYAVFPAEEVPMHFTYRSSGNSITVMLNEMPLGKSIKFKACFICCCVDEDKVPFHRGDVRVRCNIKSGENSVFSSEVVDQFSPGHLQTFVVEVETEELISTELVFKFHIGGNPDYHGEADYMVEEMFYSTLEVTECGILQLMEVPLLSSRAGDEDYELSHIELVRDDEGYEPSDNESSGDGSGDYEPSDTESSGDGGEDYEP